MVGSPKEGQKRRITQEECCKWMLATTKGDKRFVKGVSKMTQALYKLVARENQMAADEMVNLNKDFIFNEGRTPDDFIQYALQNTWKCNDKIFDEKGQVVEVPLDSDCLSPDDVSKMSTLFLNAAFVQRAVTMLKEKYEL